MSEHGAAKLTAKKIKANLTRHLVVDFAKLREASIFPISGAVELQLHGGSLGIGNHKGIRMRPSRVFETLGGLRHGLDGSGLCLVQLGLVHLVNLGQALLKTGYLGILLPQGNPGIAFIYPSLSCGAASAQYDKKE